MLSMARFRRISFYFILVIIDISPVFIHAQTSNSDPAAICKALSQNTLCVGNRGQTMYPSPGLCREFYTCTGQKLHTGRCTGSNRFDAQTLACRRNNPLCYPSCDTYTTSVIPSPTTPNVMLTDVPTSNLDAFINITKTDILLVHPTVSTTPKITSTDSSIPDTTKVPVQTSTTKRPALPTWGRPPTFTPSPTKITTSTKVTDNVNFSPPNSTFSSTGIPNVTPPDSKSSTVSLKSLQTSRVPEFSVNTTTLTTLTPPTQSSSQTSPTSTQTLTSSQPSNVTSTLSPWITHGKPTTPNLQSTAATTSHITKFTTTQPVTGPPWITPGTQTRSPPSKPTTTPAMIYNNDSSINHTSNVNVSARNEMTSPTSDNINVTDYIYKTSLLTTSSYANDFNTNNNSASVLPTVTNSLQLTDDQTTESGSLPSMNSMTTSGYDVYNNPDTSNVSISVDNKTLLGDINTVTLFSPSVSSMVVDTSSLSFEDRSGDSDGEGLLEFTKSHLSMLSSTNIPFMHESPASTSVPNVVGISTTESQAQCTFPLPCQPKRKVGDQNNCVKFYQCSKDGSRWDHVECTWSDTKYDYIMESCVQSTSAPKCQNGCPFKRPDPPTTTASDVSTTYSITTSELVAESTANPVTTPTASTAKTSNVILTSETIPESTVINFTSDTITNVSVVQTTPPVITSTVNEVKEQTTRVVPEITSNMDGINVTMSSRAIIQTTNKTLTDTTIVSTIQSTDTSQGLTTEETTLPDIVNTEGPQTSTIPISDTVMTTVTETTSKTQMPETTTSLQTITTSESSTPDGTYSTTRETSTLAETTSWMDNSIAQTSQGTSKSGDVFTTQIPVESTAQQTGSGTTELMTETAAQQTNRQTTPTISSETTSQPANEVTSQGRLETTSQPSTMVTTTQAMPDTTTQPSDTTVGMTDTSSQRSNDVTTSKGLVETTTGQRDRVTTQGVPASTAQQGDTTTEGFVTTDLTTDSPTTDTTQQPLTACNRTSSCEEGLILPDPDNCGNYFECISIGISNNTNWRNKRCEQGELFDKFDLACSNNTNTSFCQEPCVSIPPVSASITPGQTQPPTPVIGVSTTVITPANNTTTPSLVSTTTLSTATTTRAAVQIKDHSLIVMPNAALEGSDYKLQCLFSTVPANQPYTLSWYLNGEKLRNSNRIKISITESVSSLLFTPLHAMDSGNISCSVQLRTGQSSIKSLPVAVIAKPVVSLDVLSVTVSTGQRVSITCTAQQVVSTTKPPQNFVWYRNGVSIESNDKENITTTQWTSQLVTVPNVDVNYSCAAQNEAGEGERRRSSVVVLQSGTSYCDFDQNYGINWTKTAVGQTNIQKCPNDMIGEAKRQCEETDDGSAQWNEANLNHCVDREFLMVLEKVNRIEEGIGGDSAELSQLASALEKITNVTTTILPGNLNITCESTQKLGKMRLDHMDIRLPEEELEAMANTLSNLLSEMNEESWNSIQDENPNRSVSVMYTVDAYREAAASQLTAGESISISTDNLVLEAECFTKADSRDVTFPGNVDMDWGETTSDKIVIEKQTLDSVSSTLPGNNIAVSSSYYKNIDRLLPSYNPSDSPGYLNSRVLAVSVSGLESGKMLDPPVQMGFTQEQVISTNYTANCSFWSFEKSMWSTEGCTVVYSNSSYGTCQCNHLTNFAVLVTRNPVEGVHAYILGIISIVGCVISIGGMILTILIYISIWKHVKSHHAVVLLNLCVALIIANLIFITGVDKTEPREACIAVAVLLHYFYLAAFCLMLVEGIQLILYIIYVFHVRRKRETASLIVLGWLVPAIIVAICLGINKTEGYGNEDYCWLDPNTWLFWVFIVPVGIIVVINVIILICVLKRISTSKIHQIDKNRNQKIKSSIWNIVVVMPILGITWLFGVFSVNIDGLAFQYIFAISNSLQGLFIFIFHALCNKKALGRRKSGSGSTMSPKYGQSSGDKSSQQSVQETLTSSKKGSIHSVSTSGLLAHILPGKKGRYHVKTPSSVRTQRSRLKSDSSGKNGKSVKKGSKDKTKNSLSMSTESPPYDTIPADFMDFETKPPADAFNAEGKFVIENDYMIPNTKNDHVTNGGYRNPTFNTFGADPSNLELSLSETDNSTVARLNFVERLNSVTEMRTEEYMDVKLSTDNVRFRDSPRTSPFLPRSTPFLAKHSPQMPVKAQTSFNC